MKKQFFLLGFAAMAAVSACNDSNTNGTTGNGDSSKTLTTSTTTTTRGRMISNFANRSFVDLKTGKPVRLVWDTVHYYYIDQTTNQEPGFYYDPSSHDTFDYRGRVLNNALMYTNGDYNINETRVPADDMMSTDTSTITTYTMSEDTTTTMVNGKMKTKVKDDKFKEKTDTTKVKIKSK